MSYRFIDWIRNTLPTKTTTIDGTENIYIDDAGTSKKATLSDAIRYGGGNSTRVTTVGNANISQKSDGTMWLEVTGQTAGNARGAGAFDWQAVRTDAANVASGTRCFAFGSTLQVGGTEVIAFGNEHNVGGSRALYIGRGASGTNATNLTIASGTSLGRHQTIIVPLGAVTTNATPVAMVTMATSGYFVIATNTAWKVRGDVICSNTSTGASAAFTLDFAIKRVSNTVSLIGTPTITSTGADSGMATTDGVTITVTADSTNYTPSIAVTGLAATSIRWTGSLFVSQANW